MALSRLAYRILLVSTLLAACAPVREPVPPGVIPEAPAPDASSSEAGMQVRAQLIEQFGLWENPSARRRVESILEELFRVTPTSSRWTLTLLQGSEVVNAAATRGNQIFVWQGMVEQVQSDASLAAVLGHEIAHVLARHVEPQPAETVNRALAALAGAAVGGVVANRGASTQAAQTAGSLASATVAGAIVNPYSQKLELEADTIGLFLMADAGFDPARAIDFWMQNRGAESRLASFFSTHPLSSERIENLKSHLPEATRRYQNTRR